MDKVGILLYTEKSLHQPTEPVKDITSELLEQVSKMLFCMVENRGVGVSANQVGINKRFCVASLNNGKSQLALINPVIKEKSKKKILLQEGCLSAPRIWLPTKRAQRIVITFTSLKGEENEYELTDIDARIIQHEIDHLDGKLITDRFITVK